MKRQDEEEASGQNSVGHQVTARAYAKLLEGL